MIQIKIGESVIWDGIEHHNHVVEKKNSNVVPDPESNTNPDTVEWHYRQNEVKDFKIILSKTNGKLNKYGQLSFKFAGFNQWTNALKVIETGDCIYEDFKCCKAFIDYEYYHPYDEYDKDKEGYEKIALYRLKTMITYINNGMRKLTNKSDYKILITKSHGIVEKKKEGKCYKFSFHFIVNGPYRFRNSRDARQLMNIIKESTNNPDVTKWIDGSVYKNDPNALQKFRCIFSPKTPTDKRMATPVDGNDNIIQKVTTCDYIICHSERDDIVYLPSLPDDEPIKKSTKKSTTKKSTQKTTNKRQQPKQTSGIQNKKSMMEDENYDTIMMIYHKLKKEIPSVYLECYRKDPTSGLIFYTYNYDHTVDKCIHGCEEHDHIGGYAYVRNNNIVYAGCYSQNCKDKKSIQVGNVLEPSFWSQFNFEPYEEKTSALGYESENEPDNDTDTESDNEPPIQFGEAVIEYNDKSDDEINNQFDDNTDNNSVASNNESDNESNNTFDNDTDDNSVVSNDEYIDVPCNESDYEADIKSDDENDNKSDNSSDDESDNESINILSYKSIDNKLIAKNNVIINKSTVVATNNKTLSNDKNSVKLSASSNNKSTTKLTDTSNSKAFNKTPTAFIDDKSVIKIIKSTAQSNNNSAAQNNKKNDKNCNKSTPKDNKKSNEITTNINNKVLPKTDQKIRSNNTKFTEDTNDESTNDTNHKSNEDECIINENSNEDNEHKSSNCSDLSKLTKLTKDDIVRFYGRKILKNRIAREAIIEYIKKSGKKVLCMKSKMGTGKTFALRKIIRLFADNFDKNSSILVISTRRSYASDVANNTFKNLGFVNYLDKKTNLSECNRLIISLESLHKLYTEDYIRCYDMIVLDESESVMDQFFSKTIEDKRETYYRLEELMHYSKKMIILDADLDNRTMEYVLSITTDVRILYNEYKGIPRKYIVTNNDKKYIGTIIQNIRDGENICVVSLAKDFGVSLRDRLQQEFPDIANKIVCLHKESDDGMKKELNNIRKNWTKYRVLIYTSLVGCGLNYDVYNHFNSVYAYAVGKIETVRTFIQMMSRVRFPTVSDINVLISSRMSKRTDALLYSLDYVFQQYRSSFERNSTDRKQIVYLDKNGRFIKNNPKTIVWNRLRAYHIQEHLNNNNSNFLTMFKLLIEEKNDTFITDFTDDKTEKLIIKKNIDRLLEKETLDSKAYTELINKGDLTEDDKLVIEKTQMKHDLNFTDNVPEEKLNECLQIANDKKEVITIMDNIYKKEIQHDENDYSIDNDVRSNIHNAYDKVMNALDCKFVRGVKKYNKNDCDTKIDSINFTNEELNSLEVKGKRIDKYAIVKAVLARFGITLRVRTVKTQVKKVRKKIRIGYDLNYDNDVYNVIYCKIINDRNNYDKNFVNFVNNFTAYKNYMNIKKRSIYDLPRLFI
jgi:hypothetical protein